LIELRDNWAASGLGAVVVSTGDYVLADVKRTSIASAITEDMNRSAIKDVGSYKKPALTVAIKNGSPRYIGCCSHHISLLLVSWLSSVDEQLDDADDGENQAGTSHEGMPRTLPRDLGGLCL
jgi:hypothetical protein